MLYILHAMQLSLFNSYTKPIRLKFYAKDYIVLRCLLIHLTSGLPLSDKECISKVMTFNGAKGN